MYDNVCYRKPFLREVIARVDFSAPEPSISSKLAKSVANKALSRFPILEQRKTLAQELQVSSVEIHHKREEFTEWNYHGREREKRLVVSPGFIFVTYSRYTAFEDLKTDFLTVLSELFSHYSDLQGSRFGIRYINAIEVQGQDVYDWSNLVDSRLLGLFSRFAEDRRFVARLFHFAEFKYDDDIKVKFQYGVPNPDFPARIRSPQFIIDIDAYAEGLQDISAIRENIESGHSRVQALFEQSITDELRGLMHAAR